MVSLCGFGESKFSEKTRRTVSRADIWTPIGWDRGADGGEGEEEGRDHQSRFNVQDLGSRTSFRLLVVASILYALSGWLLGKWGRGEDL